MPDAHNVVVVVATSRRVATLTICQTGSLSRQHLARPTPTPTSTPTATATAAEVEINYYVIEESNCDRQRCGKPLAMAANRFTSRVSETHRSPPPRPECRPCIHQSHSLFDQLSRLGACLPPQLAICETRNALFMLLL